MAEAIWQERYGGPEELRLRRLSLPPPAAGEVRLRQTAASVNFHDIYVRSGLYTTLALPGVPGLEATGVVETLGESVRGFAVGDRVGYVSPGYGAYASERNLDAALAVRLPAALGDAQAAASLLRGLTACVLVRRVYAVEPGDTVLVQAAAGGMGQMLCSWAHRLGATVIGTVGDPAKVETARRAGAEHVVLYRQEDVRARVRAITGGEGVAVAYDSVGADTFLVSLDCLAYEGSLVSFGQASGPVAPFAPSQLAARSLTLARPIIFHYLRTPEKLQALAAEVFEAFREGALTPITPLELPLAKAAEAHRMLQAGQSPGGVVLIPTPT